MHSTHFSVVGMFVLLLTMVTVEFTTGGSASNADLHVWKTYTNVRFQYSVCYPRDLFVPQGEAENGDGQKFLSRGGAQMVVFGWNNALNESLRSVMKETGSRMAGRSGRITYEVIKTKWFVVSGKTDGSIFYAKTILSGNQFKSFALTYRDSDRAIFGPFVGKMGACFQDLAR